MRSFEELIELLVSKDIKLRTENGKLKYNAPAGSVTAELLAEIKNKKDELLEFMSAKQKNIIKPYTDKESIPLSFAQNRLWFLDKLEEDSFAYNLPFPVKIEGALNITAINKALKHILKRHSVLRTSFPEKDGVPYQKINEIGEEEFPFIEASGESFEEKSEWVNKYINEQSRKPFDLENGPLYRVKILFIDENIHVLLMVFHHIILDGWSIDILLKEISECYNAFSTGSAADLPALGIQYSDFSIWHNEWLNGPEAMNQLEYWKNELADAPALLRLSSVKTRPAVQTLNGKTEQFEIDQEMYKRLKQLANKNGCSLFMVLYAAFCVLLYRYSGMEDITVGTTIANRNRAEIEPLVGLFANTIVLRSDLSGNPIFKNFLAGVKEKTLHAYANQDIPFEKIVEEVKPERSLSHTPLFQILFELQEIPAGPEICPDLKMTAIEPENISAKFDMNILLLVKEGKLIGNMEYNSDLYDKDYMVRFAGHYKEILNNILEDIECRIDEIDYVTAEEKKILNEWNDTHADFPVNQTYDELFLDSVKQYPDKTAAFENGIKITYSELNRRAEMLAVEISGNGAGPEKVVAILAGRGIKFLVSVLAVFKSGAAYLPLDPRHPAARHAQIIRQSKPVIVLTEEKYKGIVNESVIYAGQENIEEMFIDDILKRKMENVKLKKPVSAPDNLAYIIFTSGSTGKPKGAMVLQKGMLNHLYSKIRDLNITSRDKIAQNASQCFDISVWQYLAALLVGGQIDILSDGTILDTKQFLKKVDEDNISILEVVPSFMSVMIEMPDIRTKYSFRKLRWLVPTGEALPPELAFKWLEYFPHIPLMNAYGPTECSDDVTHCAIYKTEDIKNSTVPIGRPIANTKILILDKNNRMVPNWVTGELYIGGICVGRGYINDEEKTRSAFLENPFNPGEIIYRSGDLARYLPDGNIEFMGRADEQVKVRGFRIEPGEIENELRKYKNVKDALVAVDKHGRELIGYIVRADDVSTHKEDIKNYLKNRLPEYMIPSHFVFVDRFPLTANGKIDRSALPVPVIDPNEEKIALPETDTEKIIAGIWKDLLRIEQPGINRNFFEIGGHSLLATRLITRLRDKFSVDLALKIIFEKTTVKSLAEYIDTLLWFRESPDPAESEDIESIII